MAALTTGVDDAWCVGHVMRLAQGKRMGWQLVHCARESHLRTSSGPKVCDFDCGQHVIQCDLQSRVRLEGGDTASGEMSTAVLADHALECYPPRHYGGQNVANLAGSHTAGYKLRDFGGGGGVRYRLCWYAPRCQTSSCSTKGRHKDIKEIKHHIL